MRKIYTCKECGYQTSIYDGLSQSNSPLFNCPQCFFNSVSTDIEDWADISWISFDQDIEQSIIDGSFNLAFPEIRL